MNPARWTPTSDDLRHAKRTARMSGPFVARHPQQLYGLLLVVVTAVLWVVGVHSLVLLGAGFANLLVLPAFQDHGLWQGVFFRQPVEATLTDDELVHTGTGVVRFVSAWPWTAFRYAVETPEQFVLVGAKEKTGFVPYLPKRALTDLVAVRTFLAERMEVRSPRPGPRWSRRRGSGGTGSARSSSGS